MITIRKSKDRGVTQTPWLESFHTFNFGSHYDPSFTRFGPLRVINEDIVKPGEGFQPHSHQDMEIITYVLEGALEHKDSLGSGSIIVPGEVQFMRAGSGITHSEFNPSKTDFTHLLQIWIITEEKALPPAYQQKDFHTLRGPGQLTLLVSRDGENNSLTIRQDARLYVLDLDPGQSYTYSLKAGRMAWVQVARGAISLNDQMLEQGDGASAIDEAALNFVAPEKAEILLFDLGQPAG